MAKTPAHTLKGYGYTPAEPSFDVVSMGGDDDVINDARDMLPSKFRDLHWQKAGEKPVSLDAALYWNGQQESWCGLSALRLQSFMPALTFNDGARDINIQYTWRKPVAKLGDKLLALPGDRVWQGLNAEAVDNWRVNAR